MVLNFKRGRLATLKYCTWLIINLLTTSIIRIQISIVHLMQTKEEYLPKDY